MICKKPVAFINHKCDYYNLMRSKNHIRTLYKENTATNFNAFALLRIKD